MNSRVTSLVLFDRRWYWNNKTWVLELTVGVSTETNIVVYLIFKKYKNICNVAFRIKQGKRMNIILIIYIVILNTAFSLQPVDWNHVIT